MSYDPFDPAGQGSSSVSSTLIIRDYSTLGAWKRQFYRLTNTSSDDDQLSRVDPDDLPEEGVLFVMQAGLDAAQEFLLALGLSGWWVKRSDDPLSFSGSDAADGGRYADLPSDFVRIAADQRNSAIVEENGDPWGRFCEWEERSGRGNGYYLRGRQLWLLRDAKLPPGDVYLDYIYRLGLPEEDEQVFELFPPRALQLVPAFAAEQAMHEEWLPGGQELEAKIDRHLRRVKQKAAWALRLRQGARRMKTDPTIGNHFWL